MIEAGEEGITMIFLQRKLIGVRETIHEQKNPTILHEKEVWRIAAKSNQTSLQILCFSV